MASTFVPLAPKNLGHPPAQWSAAEVRAWLKFCVEEFALSPICSTRFDMNGKALCLLTRTDFMERAPHAGDVLFNAFQKLRQEDGTQLVCHPQFPTGVILTSPGSTHTSPPGRQSFVPILPQPRPLSSASSTTVAVSTTAISSSGVNNQIHSSVSVASNSDALSCIPINLLSPDPSEQSPSDTSDSSCLYEQGNPGQNTMELETGMEVKPEGLTCPSPCHDDGASSGEGGCRLLWEFVYQLLQDSRYAHLVAWESESELTFRINDQTGLADLWGQQKNKDNMTYEKLSRALRYYYKMNIIKKVTGRRLTYRFLQHPTKIKRGQRGARPHASRVAAAQQADVTPHVTSSSASGSHSPGNEEEEEEEEEDTKTVQIPVPESAADSTACIKPFTTSESSNPEQESVVGYSNFGETSFSARSPTESPMTLPVLISSSISVGSNIFTAVNTLSSPPLFILPATCSSKENGTVEFLKSDSDPAATMYQETGSDENCDKNLDTTGSILSHESAADHNVREIQHEHTNIPINFLNGCENSDDSGRISTNQNCVDNFGPEPPQSPLTGDFKLTCNSHSSLDDSKTESREHQQDGDSKLGQHFEKLPTRHHKSPPSSLPSMSPTQAVKCQSPLVYTELIPKQSLDLKETSRQNYQSYTASHIGCRPGHSSQHIRPSAIDHIHTDSEFRQSEMRQSLYQAQPIPSKNLNPFSTTDTHVFEPYFNRPMLQNNNPDRPETPYLENYQGVHENSQKSGPAIDRVDFSTKRKPSTNPTTPNSSYTNNPNSPEPLMQLHVSVSRHPFFDKRKADEPIELCNTYPAHQKKICLSQSQRSASPFPIQHFSHSCDIHPEASLVCPASHPDVHYSSLSLPCAHTSYGNDHSVSLKNYTLPGFDTKPNLRDHCYERSFEFGYANGVTASEMGVMDLSKPSRHENLELELEQEEPEDLSMKPKPVPVGL